jgi:hypothetical protein
VADISHICYKESFKDKALILAEKYSLKLNSPATKQPYLYISENPYIKFKDKKIVSSFSAGSFANRIKNFQRETLLKKAIGYGGEISKKILDCTAGLGHDAFILALLKQNVTVIEKNKGLCILFELALESLPHTSYFQEAKERITVINDDSESFVDKLFDYDVVYIDPMFEDRGAAGRSGTMSLISDYLDDFTDVSNVLIGSKYNRLVIKRQKQFKQPGNVSPSFILSGKSINFHVFI